MRSYRCDLLWGFVSVRRVRLGPLLTIALLAAASGTATLSGCGTVEQGEDYAIADVVYDENYYYCVVEPMLFARSCGPGDPSQGDGNGSCHFNVTSFRLSNYSPLVGEACGGGVVVPAGVPIPPQARGNYTSASAKMALNPDAAPLFNRPTGKAAHPRVVIPSDDPDAQIIKDWAQKFSTQ